MVIGEFEIRANPTVATESGIIFVGRKIAKPEVDSLQTLKRFLKSRTGQKFGGTDLSKPINIGELTPPKFNSSVELRLGKMNEVRTKIQSIERYRHLSQVVLPRLAETITAGMIAARIAGII